MPECAKCGAEMVEKSSDAFERESYYECPSCGYCDILDWEDKEEFKKALLSEKGKWKRRKDGMWIKE